MGICASDAANLKNNHREIEREIEVAKRKPQIKLLLLGTAGSGKSTILKQMRIVHQNGFTDEEMQSYRQMVYVNIIISMHKMIEAMNGLGLEFTNPDSTKHKDVISKIVSDRREQEPIEAELKQSLTELWSDKAIQQAYAMRQSFHLHDSAKYFLDNLDRVTSDKYRPSQQDVLYLRVPTNGIVEVKFYIRDTLFRVIDVGGHRSERRKWIHCFDDVVAIIFITAVSEFDQTQEEDGKTNSLHESLDLFRQICNSGWFPTKVGMILFLNKTDLFASKIERFSITSAFPGYKGSQDCEESLDFIEQKYNEAGESCGKTVYVHRTCATNTNQVKLVLKSVLDTIFDLNMEDSGLT